MFEHTAKDTSQRYNLGFDKIQGEISHYFKPIMPGLKPTGASIGRSSAAITCVLLCKKLSWGVAVSRVHSQNHINHLHLFFFLEKTCNGYDGYISVRKRNYGFSTWRVMHTLFWHLSTSRQFSEATANQCRMYTNIHGMPVGQSMPTFPVCRGNRYLYLPSLGCCDCRASI